jgi:adenosine kinase
MEQQNKHVFVIGNPLLDISVEVKDNSILDKYELGHGLTTLAGEKQLPIYDELWGMENKLAIPGGSGLNSARSVNFFLKNNGLENRVVYYGSIASDDKGKTLENVLKEEGISGNFSYCEDAPTGTCAVIVKDKERTLCANLAAACKYNIDHLHNNMDALRNASIIYSTSFFITSNPAALQEVGQFASDNNIPFGFNLSAAFLI